jgi:hypothetical protein
LFHRRLQVAQEHPDLRQHVHILERLGVDGMSSDESDFEELRRHPHARLENPRCYVLRPRWRALLITNWLHVFDSLHIVSRQSLLGPLRGAYPHLRIYNAESPRVSNSQSFVRDLPINAYDAQWIANTTRVDYSVRPDRRWIYDFSHSNSLFQ